MLLKPESCWRIDRGDMKAFRAAAEEEEADEADDGSPVPGRVPEG